MESYKIEGLSFKYPERENKALDNINLTVNKGEFVTVCGKSGCGKTTLLRLLKPTLSPYGELNGNIFFNKKPLSELNSRQQASEIGFVMQNPDNQIVTDKVWHELSFGLESLGYDTQDIRARVSEMASFFGIQTWFYKKVTELSGGQKQLLNLASIMVMQPSVLILDEPTSQLDPIAAQEFLKTLEKINRELGTTVILTEHRLEDAFAVSDRIIVMDNGKIIADSTPKKVGEILKSQNHDMYFALPTPIKVYGAVKNELECPVTVRDGRSWLERFSENNTLRNDLIPKKDYKNNTSEIAIEIKDAWFRYEKSLPDVIKNLNIKINKGEFFAIVGGNGTGKTTALSLMSGLNTSYRGEIYINGEKISKIDGLYNGILGVLPQNPQTLFVKKTVYLDLCEMLSDKKLSKEEKESQINIISKLCRIDDFLGNHPYDLSGGEQQRVALAKVLLKSPEILLLDEPTKGMDASFKEIFADIIADLKKNSVTVVMVSHDIEFCAEYADRCAMFFDGNITSTGNPREFFSGKNFYTTSANRMARTVLPDAVLSSDIILACGGIVCDNKKDELPKFILPKNKVKKEKKEVKKMDNKKLTPKRIFFGIIFAVLFLITVYLEKKGVKIPFINLSEGYDSVVFQLLSIITASIACGFFIPKKELDTEEIHTHGEKRKLRKRTLMSVLFILIAVPLTIYIGFYYLQDKKYYFISLLIILETLLPFLMIFEDKKPEARELIVISVICAVCIAGRYAFFMLPQFKPVIAIIIIAGICFGGETGFLVGAVSGFVSNFFFGQGPWTPWQMFSMGIIGFVSGILFKKGILRKTKVSLCIFGGLSVLILYGGIMNPATVLMWQPNPTSEMIISSYVMGFPFDLVHAASTAFFLWFLSEPMIDKLERIKKKYGLIEG